MSLPLAILLDFDGTVVDSENVGMDALNIASKEVLGEPFAPEVYDQFLGRSEVMFFAHVAELVGEANAEAVRKRYQAAYLPLLKKLPPLPGVMDWLPKLAAIAPIVAVSGSHQEQVAGYIEGLGLSRVLHSVIGCESYQRGKPDPQPFEFALSQIGVRADRALAIEDSDVGVSAGKAAGVKVLAFRVGNPEGRYHLQEADLVLESFEELTIETLKSVMN